MKVLIIEDEPQAANWLESLVRSIEPETSIQAKIDSIKRAVSWLTSNPMPDLIFMDIQLADGLSFQIFEKCEVSAPVIFTTAYDSYALQAFKVNSIDYILKPVDRDELQQAMAKFHGLGRVSQKVLLENIDQAIQMLTKKFKTRFVIKVGEHLRSLEVKDIRFFLSQEKATFCYTVDGRKNIIDYTLDQLDDMLDSSRFFRINRKYIVSVEAIKDMISYTNSRLKLVLTMGDDSAVIVARERVGEFKAWLDR